MINADMRFYNYSTIGEQNAYGQPTLNDNIKGSIKMAIYTFNQTIQDNIRYRDASYIGFTHSSIDDSYIIHLEEEKLKVLYVQPKGRYIQVFLKNI